MLSGARLGLAMVSFAYLCLAILWTRRRHSSLRETLEATNHVLGDTKLCLATLSYALLLFAMLCYDMLSYASLCLAMLRYA